MQLPLPDAESAAHSERVAEHIRVVIDAAGGVISFAQFMQEALYAPGLGYYAAGTTKLGAGGDFVTAPEVSTLFGEVVASQCGEVLRQVESGAILEFGAGSGKLACDVLRALERRGELPPAGYQILEVSPDLRERQETFLRQQIPSLAGVVSWLDALPENHIGVVLANEVLDALPVERFVSRTGNVAQLCVATDGADFTLIEKPAPGNLVAAVREIERSIGIPLPDGYASEVCLAAPLWLTDVAGALGHGAIFLFDYGLSRREYYAADRSGGWLRCHFRHRAHDDPLILPGIQDLTSWVDFSAVAGAAVDAGLDVLGFVTQAQFMIGGGLERVMSEYAKLPSDAQLKLSAEVKLLTLPTEMGEHFKCLGLVRGDIATPTAFGIADRTATLG